MEALRQTTRRTIILPAFICPELPAMALQAGLRVIHVDVDQRTLHMDPRRVVECLSRLPLSETALLVDHSFGYPDPEVARYRRAYPEILLIEDCVRALGSEIADRPIGSHGDWVLFSMYKTTRGNDDGAILMTRTAYALPAGPSTRPTLRQWASTLRPLRAVHGLVKRRGAGLEPAERDLEVPSWRPQLAQPNWLVLRRFAGQLQTLVTSRNQRERASDEIRAALKDIPELRFIEAQPGCRASAFFLTFTVADQHRRDSLVMSLHRQGFFLVWAWNSVPAFYRCFATTFPFGYAQSTYLADHVCHIPLVDYVDLDRRRRLVVNFRKALDRE
jgi:dTDP-4-amino-4,6-dideoxygalactose transaminase